MRVVGERDWDQECSITWDDVGENIAIGHNKLCGRDRRAVYTPLEQIGDVFGSGVYGERMGECQRVSVDEE